jgi:predicted HicB family RNase H-like nuclease
VKSLTLRLKPEMHQEANRAAAGRGMVLTVWIRQAIAEKIARDKAEAAR